MTGRKDQAHSTLEAVPSAYGTLEAVPNVYGTLEAVPNVYGALEPVPNAYGTLEAVPKTHKTLEAVSHQAHQPSRRKRKWILYVGVVGLIALILAAVLGGVLGSRHKSSATVSPSSPSQSSVISPSPPPNSSVGSPSARPPQRNIAALSFALNSVNNTRVYFEDNAGQIMEAANSAANTTWSINKIGIGAKNGSAIAAAVSRPDFPLVS